MSKKIKGTVLFLAITFIAPMLLYLLPFIRGVTVTEAFAAEKEARLDTTEITMGFHHSFEGGIKIEDINEKAVNTYQSSNKKIVTVHKEYGWLDDVSKGSAFITVTETLDGVSRELGKVKVNVVGTSLDKECKVGLSGTESSADIRIPINYENYRAKYSYKSSDSGTVEVNEYGNIYSKKFGSAHVSVTEVYKGKSTYLGKIKVKVVKAQPRYPSLQIPITPLTDKPIFFDNLISYRDTRKDYVCISSDKNIAIADGSFGQYVYGLTCIVYSLKGIKKGTTSLTIYEEYKGEKKVIGTVNATVKETITEFTFDPAEFEMVDGMFTTTYYLEDENPSSNLTDMIIKEPYEDMSAVSFSSNDESVVRVDDKGNIALVGKGTTILKATCEDWSTELKMTVE